MVIIIWVGKKLSWLPKWRLSLLWLKLYLMFFTPLNDFLICINVSNELQFSVAHFFFYKLNVFQRALKIERFRSLLWAQKEPTNSQNWTGLIGGNWAVFQQVLVGVLELAQGGPEAIHNPDSQSSVPRGTRTLIITEEGRWATNFTIKWAVYAPRTHCFSCVLTKKRVREIS